MRGMAGQDNLATAALCRPVPAMTREAVHATVTEQRRLPAVRFGGVSSRLLRLCNATRHGGGVADANGLGRRSFASLRVTLGQTFGSIIYLFRHSTR
jgi:hypothetical protein